MIEKKVCPAGHHYNAGKYSSCPICAKLNPSAISSDLQPDKTVSLQQKAETNCLAETMSNRHDINNVSHSHDESSALKPSSTLQREIGRAKEKVSAISDDSKTVAYYHSGKSEPVVGWLVGIKGEYYGESFAIFAGRNDIGRGSGMDIALVNEMSVSRNKHAVITFDPKSCKFLIQAGESRGLTYLNGSLVVSHEELKAYDVVTLAEAVFIFMPLCGEKFNWDDTEKYCNIM